MKLQEFTKNSFKYEMGACLEAAVVNMALHCPDTWHVISNSMEQFILLNGHMFSYGEVLGQPLSGLPSGERYSYMKMMASWRPLLAWMIEQTNDISLVESVGECNESDTSLTVQMSLDPSVLIDGKKHGVLDCKFAILRCYFSNSTYLSTYFSTGINPDGAFC